MRKYFSGVFFIAAALIIGGCRTPEYYQNRAVEDAREYLLENSPELTVSEKAYVKFNKPALLVQNIGGPGNVSPENTFFSKDLSQICIAWVIPSKRPVYMVFGVSSGSMSDWVPQRMIRKIFEPLDRNRFAATTTAREYAQNSLFSTLSTEDYNHIRFSDPRVVTTNFEPAPADGVDLGNLTQSSLVWDMPTKPGMLVVITGYGASDLSDWSVNTGGERTGKDLEAHTVMKVESNEDFVNEAKPESADLSVAAPVPAKETSAEPAVAADFAAASQPAEKTGAAEEAK